MNDIIHIHNAKINRNLDLFLLLIPVVTFIFICLLLLLKTANHKEFAFVQKEPTVLGEEIENPIKP